MSMLVSVLQLNIPSYHMKQPLAASINMIMVIHLITLECTNVFYMHIIPFH